jgi:hypothetical protein
VLRWRCLLAAGSVALACKRPLNARLATGVGLPCLLACRRLRQATSGLPLAVLLFRSALSLSAACAGEDGEYAAAASLQGGSAAGGGAAGGGGGGAGLPGAAAGGLAAASASTSSSSSSSENSLGRGVSADASARASAAGGAPGGSLGAAGGGDNGSGLAAAALSGRALAPGGQLHSPKGAALHQRPAPTAPA